MAQYCDECDDGKKPCPPECPGKTHPDDPREQTRERKEERDREMWAAGAKAMREACVSVCCESRDANERQRDWAVTDITKTTYDRGAVQAQDLASKINALPIPPFPTKDKK